ncbi:hypothetical protein KP509_32G076600 [Ceratopteris richardii]|uniref:Uncharacterized protein n=1 Tax=Ceratopteris richardii TaxID=49495 RepID=A0A8T2QWV3_CERRI|nr:hypothetical protein KP509_32G076600 [Ceratopteris richardii]
MTRGIIRLVALIYFAITAGSFCSFSVLSLASKSGGKLEREASDRSATSSRRQTQRKMETRNRYVHCDARLQYSDGKAPYQVQRELPKREELDDNRKSIDRHSGYHLHFGQISRIAAERASAWTVVGRDLLHVKVSNETEIITTTRSAGHRRWGRRRKTIRMRLATASKRRAKLTEQQEDRKWAEYRVDSRGVFHEDYARPHPHPPRHN